MTAAGDTLPADYLLRRRLSGRSQARSRCPVLPPPVDTGWARGFPEPVAGSGSCPAASVDAGSVAGARPLPGLRRMVQAGEPLDQPVDRPAHHAGILARHRQADASDSCAPPASRAPRQGSPGRSGSGVCPDSCHGTAPRLNLVPARFHPGCPPDSGSARCAPRTRPYACPSRAGCAAPAGPSRTVDSKRSSMSPLPQGTIRLWTRCFSGCTLRRRAAAAAPWPGRRKTSIPSTASSSCTKKARRCAGNPYRPR